MRVIMRRKGCETILVVDDDAGILGSIDLVLSPLGYRLLLASSGEEALELAEQKGEKIDLLFADIMLAGITGLDLARQFLKKYPGTKIMFMSGYMCPSIAHQGVRFSEKAFIKKPFTANTLVNKLRAVLKSNYVPEIDDREGRDMRTDYDFQA